MQVLILSVHPDDETLGCGGTILRHRERGDELHWLVATQATEPQWTAAVIERKAAEVAAVARAYGVRQVYKLGLPTARLDTLPQGEMIGAIRGVVDEARPEVVYLVHHGDVHTDHHAFFTATLSVLKSFSMRKSGVRRILSYETLSSTEAAAPLPYRAFMPNVYHEITPYLDRKVEIMNLYASEAHPDPMPRGPSAIRALARLRGAAIGVEYAEAFMLIREVD
jgi:N-acetylglucosamine malate deacetylase 1